MTKLIFILVGIFVYGNCENKFPDCEKILQCESCVKVEYCTFVLTTNHGGKCIYKASTPQLKGLIKSVFSTTRRCKLFENFEGIFSQ
jgi:hypothetical protein